MIVIVIVIVHRTLTTRSLLAYASVDTEPGPSNPANHWLMRGVKSVIDVATASARKFRRKCRASAFGSRVLPPRIGIP